MPKRLPARSAPFSPTKAQVLREVDGLIADAAWHIGARQAREAVGGEQSDAGRFLDQIADAVNLLAQAQAGKRQAHEALWAARALHEAALAYDREPGR